jgi:hypothetical protein
MRLPFWIRRFVPTKAERALLKLAKKHQFPGRVGTYIRKGDTVCVVEHNGKTVHFMVDTEEAREVAFLASIKRLRGLSSW